MSIKVLIADRHEIVRRGIRSLLEKDAGFEVVAEAETVNKAVKLAGKLLPDVVMLDISKPEKSGIEGTRRIVAEMPGVRVLAISIYMDIRSIMEEMNAGAKGYLLKDCSSKELVEAIRAVSANKTYICPKLSKLIVKDYLQHKSSTVSPTFTLLSSREREVLQLIAEGKNAKEIAFSLDLSIKTAETHRQHIMKKLNLYSVADLTKFAVREGLTSLH